MNRYRLWWTFSLAATLFLAAMAIWFSPGETPRPVFHAWAKDVSGTMQMFDHPSSAKLDLRAWTVTQVSVIYQSPFSEKHPYLTTEFEFFTNPTIRERLHAWLNNSRPIPSRFTLTSMPAHPLFPGWSEYVVAGADVSLLDSLAPDALVAGTWRLLESDEVWTLYPSGRFESSAGPRTKSTWVRFRDTELMRDRPNGTVSFYRTPAWNGQEELTRILVLDSDLRRARTRDGKTLIKFE